MIKDYLIENELGYTNYHNGKYVTEENATHIAIREDGHWSVVVYEREQLDLG